MAGIETILGDCFEELSSLPDQSFDGVCTDPPYGIVEFSGAEMAKLRSGRGGVWRIPPQWDGCVRKPLPRFSILTGKQKDDIETYFLLWAKAMESKLKPGGHILIAGNHVLQTHVQHGLLRAGLENRATLLRIYHGFRGGDRPKNAEREFPDVCVSPRGNYEPWMLFRKPLSEKTVAQNLRKWGVGGLRMMEGGKPIPDVIPSFKTPRCEKEISDHPSLKPQHLLRIFLRALLPLGEGRILDPFMGSGSTLAASSAIGCEAVGVEKDEGYFRAARQAIPRLARLYPSFKGETLEMADPGVRVRASDSQLQLLERPEIHGT